MKTYVVKFTTTVQAESAEHAIFKASTQVPMSRMNVLVHAPGRGYPIPHEDVREWAKARRDAELGKALLDRAAPLTAKELIDTVQRIKSEYDIQNLPRA